MQHVQIHRCGCLVLLVALFAVQLSNQVLINQVLIVTCRVPVI